METIKSSSAAQVSTETMADASAESIISTKVEANEPKVVNEIPNLAHSN